MPIPFQGASIDIDDAAPDAEARVAAHGAPTRSSRDWSTRALELSVVGGFSRIGPLVRWRVEHWTEPPSLAGRVCLVTGASSGLGLAASAGLARLGAVAAPARARRRRAARRRVAGSSAETGNDDVRCELVDISLRRSVHACAERLLAGGEPRARARAQRRRAAGRARARPSEGVELTFATNVLGPHLLTRLLRERLVASAPARVLFVSSGGMYTAAARRRRPAVARGRVRRAGGLRAQQARRGGARRALGGASWRARGVVVHAMHPGWADTPGIKSALPGFRRVMRPAAAHARAGRRHDRLARGGRRAGGGSPGRFWCDRHVRTHAPPRAHARDARRSGSGSGTALERIRGGRLRADMIILGNH